MWPWKKDTKKKAFSTGKRRRRNKFYESRSWRNLRAFILRNEPLCRLCSQKGIAKEAKVVDHIDPIEHGGAKLSPENVQPLCITCHNSKSGREAWIPKTNFRKF